MEDTEILLVVSSGRGSLRESEQFWKTNALSFAHTQERLSQEESTEV